MLAASLYKLRSFWLIRAVALSRCLGCELPFLLYLAILSAHCRAFLFSANSISLDNETKSTLSVEQGQLGKGIEHFVTVVRFFSQRVAEEIEADQQRELLEEGQHLFQST